MMAADQPDMLAVALAHAERGFHLFPVTAGAKTPPMIDGWQRRASVDPAALTAWWREQDPVFGVERIADHNPAIACNIPLPDGSYLVVLDPDCKKGALGLQSLTLLDLLYGEPGWLDTYTVRTPSGGKHLYFRWTVPLRSITARPDDCPLGPGIDVRAGSAEAGAGYVLVAGAVLDGVGTYALEKDLPIRPLPAAVAALIGAPRPPKAAPQASMELDTDGAQSRAIEYLLHHAPQAVEGAGGDNATYRTVCKVRDCGVSEAVALDLLLEHWNDRQAPPWQPDALASKVANAYRYAQDPAGRSAASADDFQPVAVPAVPAGEADALFPDPEAPEWPDPLNLFGDPELAGTPDLPPGLLPPVIERAARDIAARLGVEAGMVGLPMLVVAAACLHDEFRLQPKRHDSGWTEAARLWLGVVGDPSMKKTPALSAALAALRVLDKEYGDEHLHAMRGHARAVKEHKLREKRWNGQTPLPPEPVEPTRRRKLVEDATIEALSDILAANAAGVLTFRDELAGFFGSFDAYRDRDTGKDRADWLEAYNGGPRTIDRVTRGTISVPNWSSCMLGGVQPERMRKLAGKLSDDGLIQRFLFIFGRQVGPGEDRAPDEAAMQAYRDLIRELAGMSTPSFDPYVVRLSPEAQAHREEVGRVIGALTARSSDMPALVGHLGKLEGIYARLLVAWHACEYAAVGLHPSSTIPARTAEKVARLVLDYLLPHALQFYAHILDVRPADEHGRWIAGHVLAHKLERITARDIYRAYPDLRSPGDTARQQDGCRRAMELLEINEWAKPIRADNGRDVTRWDINPKVHDVFIEQATAEERRRAERRARLQDADAVLAGWKKARAG